MLSLLIILILSYLVGSIPTAVWTSKILLKDDIRNHGSGNAGATNVFRVMGWKPALFVVLIDIGKGTLATLVVTTICIDSIPIDHIWVRIFAGIAAIVGHIWTLFAGFRGGKGVGTTFGVLLGLAPVAFLAAGIVWIALVYFTRIVSVASIIAGIVFPLTLIIQKYLIRAAIPSAVMYLSLFLAVLIVVTHRSNIRRLVRGEENRFGSTRENTEGRKRT